MHLVQRNLIPRSCGPDGILQHLNLLLAIPAPHCPTFTAESFLGTGQMGHPRQCFGSNVRVVRLLLVLLAWQCRV